MAKKQAKSVAEDVLAADPGEPEVKKGGRKDTPGFEDAPVAEEVSEEVAEEEEEAPAPKPKGVAPVKKQRQALQKLTADGDLVDIWERRIINPNTRESLPIRITTPGMRLRWINLS